ncbi:hypothetical protein [Actinomadura alba]|uniref:Uncharacterized protein n=1 Tax=Actinomadura alba TaxID=406431 RepID=A0ABR7M189_9ACTN|nr:hypothetical protein [Actinomadura alba]MBC6470500.1 hypothetical protein [Actinomadura alba]
MIHVHDAAPQPEDEGPAAAREQISGLLQPGETFECLITGELDPYLRKPSTRLLPKVPREKLTPAQKLAAVPLMIIGLPEALVELAVEAVKWPFQRLSRFVHGRTMEGGWNSDAGRFALGVFGAHWTLRRLRDGRLLFAVTGHRLFVAVTGDDKSPRSDLTVVNVVPRGRIAARDASHHPQRQRRRIDLLFPDGSWVALRLPSATAVGELRAALNAPTASGFTRA